MLPATHVLFGHTSLPFSEEQEHVLQLTRTDSPTLQSVRHEASGHAGHRRVSVRHTFQ